MPAANVPMEIDQGEDWTVDLIWTDEYDNPVPVVHPCRLDVKAPTGQTIISLSSDPDIPEEDIPPINISTATGILQLHIPAAVTENLNPGSYQYDLFATMENSGRNQISRLIYGSCTINKRITEL